MCRTTLPMGVTVQLGRSIAEEGVTSVEMDGEWMHSLARKRRFLDGGGEADRSFWILVGV